MTVPARDDRPQRGAAPAVALGTGQRIALLNCGDRPPLLERDERPRDRTVLVDLLC
jgi:hypothetical protein